MDSTAAEPGSPSAGHDSLGFDVDSAVVQLFAVGALHRDRERTERAQWERDIELWRRIEGVGGQNRKKGKAMDSIRL